MNHISEEQLVLFYYNESGKTELEEHLGTCEECRLAYQNLQRVLNSVDSFPIPERAADYEARVWERVETRLERRPSMAGHWFTWKTLAAAAVVTILVAGAFFAGRVWNRPQSPQDASDVRERVLLVAVGDHLERSQMVLVELANAGVPATGQLDISYEQKTAEELLESNRLFRQTATSQGDMATAALLEDLERTLLEIARGPSAVSAKQLDDLRGQIEDRGILFKVKVFGSQVEERQVGAPVNEKSKL